jgi:hypothetical protein
MNDHGAITVETEETNEVRHLVDYDSDRVRSVLADLPAGTTVPVRMTRVGSRSNAWRVSDLPSGPFSSAGNRPSRPSSPVRPGLAATDAVFESARDVRV